MSTFGRKQAAQLLKGYRLSATAIQIVSFVLEVTLILVEQLWLLRFGLWPALIVSILTDILLFSPLKAGIAFFYDTVAADVSAVNFRLLFRFFHHGYSKCIGWRLGLWRRRFTRYAMFSVPCILLVLITHYSLRMGNSLLALGAFLFAIVFFVFALLATEITLLRYLPAVYLLTRTPTAKQAFRFSKRLMHRRIGEMVLLYLEYIGWFFSSILFFPFFYFAPLFQVSRAVMISDILSQVSLEDLKPQSNRGKI